MSRRGLRSIASLAGLALLLAPLGGCAVNPATGRRQLSLISESREIAMGREADEEIVATYGLYEDEALQRWIQRIGEDLAAESERPALPWTFRILDDPIVNAFALPGGFIYVTRGILTHLESEAELAGVVGHEIGHVTARHGVNQMSKAQLLGLGLEVGVAVEPGLRRFGDVAGLGLQLLFLKFGRDDERQADRLGLRYAAAEGYDPAQMPEVFRVLREVSAAQGSERMPAWLSTHPDPDNRIELVRAELGEYAGTVANPTIGRESYLRRIDGMVFGEDPRHGFFRDSEFFHPRMEFRFDFPPGWTTSNTRAAVAAVAPDEAAAVQITLEEEGSAEEAAGEFFRPGAITRGPSWVERLHGVPVVSATFAAATSGGSLRGRVVFLRHDDRVFRLVGYGTAERWASHDDSVRRSLESFRRLTDRAALDVEPERIDLVELPRTLTLESFAREYPSSVDLATLGRINHVEPGSSLPAGRLVKRVTGGP